MPAIFTSQSNAVILSDPERSEGESKDLRFLSRQEPANQEYAQ
jgi:hypothetical protein